MDDPRQREQHDPCEGYLARPRGLRGERDGRREWRPLPPPDLDCGEIDDRNFVVLEPDQHNIDMDNDGIGCESG
jgi:hypothetical protein